MLSLHLLQNCKVYVNTLMIQRVLAEPAWMARMGPEERRGLTPLVSLPNRVGVLIRPGRVRRGACCALGPVSPQPSVGPHPFLLPQTRTVAKGAMRP